MGVPKFFRWLGGRYPLVCELIKDNNIPEFDNLYLDMNGIIHNCTHPKDSAIASPTTDEERFLSIFYYIDFLFNTIRPQKVFFLAIDGVAPRAKMNEQRARRYRTAKEMSKEVEKLSNSGTAEINLLASADAENSSDKSLFDPTCITPGTEFMDKLTEALRYYVNKRISEDANWRKPEIILSAPNVPGEGEHKIMDFIRFSRAQPDYDPNTRHCLYGLDADLIMLGLLSHEPHFSLLREEVVFSHRNKRTGSESADPSMQNFYLLHLSLLRDYIDHEFEELIPMLGCSPQYLNMVDGKPAIPLSGSSKHDSYDLERIIDDYILILMLVGNDFLPHLPKLEISNGGINFILRTYSKIRPSLGGYLHDNGVLNLDRFEKFLREISLVEVDTFKETVQNHEWYRAYKSKANDRGEDIGKLEAIEAAPKGKKKFKHKNPGFDTKDMINDDPTYGLSSGLKAISLPEKDGRLVISAHQKMLLDLIKKFSIRALPKTVLARHKVQMQHLPGVATQFDDLVVARATGLLGLRVGHELDANGNTTLYITAGDKIKLSKPEHGDPLSVGSESPMVFGDSSTPYALLGSLEDDPEYEDEDDTDITSTFSSTDSSTSPLAKFAEEVEDVYDEVAVGAFIDRCLSEFENALVVADPELVRYTSNGDEDEFWKYYEDWKSGYYKSKLSLSYNPSDLNTASSGDNNPTSINSGQIFRSPPNQIVPVCRDYVATLQWVLMYYYRGCQSWSWYYPHHYAPFISDLCVNLASYKVDSFPNDEPYTPFEQLMCVLPPDSRALLPPALRPLMVDARSPILDLYPTTFKFDMNGKKMPWEAVVLIDFADIDRIRQAMASKISLLDAAETKRNNRGTTMIYSYTPLHDDDENSAPTYVPPSNLKFPVIRPLLCRGAQYEMPSLKSSRTHTALPLPKGLLRNALTRTSMYAGFPSLFTMDHTGELSKARIKVFGTDSECWTVRLTLKPNQLTSNITAEEISTILLQGERKRGVYIPPRLGIFWPYLRDSIIIGVSDKKGTYTMDSHGLKVIYKQHMNSEQQGKWNVRYFGFMKTIESSMALNVPNSPMITLHTLPLRGMQQHPDGSLVRNYGFTSSAYTQPNPSKPWADFDSWDEIGVEAVSPMLISTDTSGSWANDPRFAESAPVPINKAYPVKERVIFLGRTPFYGAPGKVVGHVYNNHKAVGVDLQLLIRSGDYNPRDESFCGVNALSERHHMGYSHYLPSYIVARELGISTLLLSRITSDLIILDSHSSSDSVRVHIGLKLKFESRGLKVIGYTKRGNNVWMYSDKAVDLISTYMDEFPILFQQLEAYSKNRDTHTVNDVLFMPNEDGSVASPARSEATAEVTRIRNWLKENVSKKVPAPVSIDTELLSSDEITAILDKSKSMVPTKTTKRFVRNVSRDTALLPSDGQYRLMGQSFKAGHRVVYIADRGGSVPFGAKGYVVGIHTHSSASSQSQPEKSGSGKKYTTPVDFDGTLAEKIHMVEIVLDKPFIDGTSLEGRCPPNHGALVKPFQILNLTTRDLAVSTNNKINPVPLAVNTIKKRTIFGGNHSNAATAEHHLQTNTVEKGKALIGQKASGTKGSESATVPEPPVAPWAGSNYPGKLTSEKSDADQAKNIISQLTGRFRPTPAANVKHISQAHRSSFSPATNTTDTTLSEDQKRAQNIIQTLLAANMNDLSINNNQNTQPTSQKFHSTHHPKPPTSAPASKPNATESVLATLLSGQRPIVVEEEYISDSMDEDEEDEEKNEDENGHNNVSYNNHSTKPRSLRPGLGAHFDDNNNHSIQSGGRGNGRGRGRGRGRGNWRGRGRGRGGSLYIPKPF